MAHSVVSTVIETNIPRPCGDVSGNSSDIPANTAVAAQEMTEMVETTALRFATRSEGSEHDAGRAAAHPRHVAGRVVV